MKFFARKQNQRLTNGALVALLVVSVMTASVPFLFSQKANADSRDALTVDVAAPTVSLRAFPGFTNATSLDITGTVADLDLSDYTYAVIDASGVVIAPVTKTTTVTEGTIGTIGISELAEGSYTVIVVARDIAGHETAQSTVFTIDRTGPGIVGQGFTKNGNVFTPHFVNSADIDHYTWTPADTNAVDGVTFDPTLISPDFTITKNGTYDFTLSVFDAAGNKTTQVLSLTYPADTTAAPIVTPAQEPTIVPAVTPVDAAVAATPAAAVTFPRAVSATATDAAVLGATDAVTTTEPAAVKGATTDRAAASIVNNNDGNVFGIAWFWWILILAALAVAAYYVTGAIRRRNAAASST